MHSEIYDYSFKYIIIDVGKSCLLLQFTDKKFIPDYNLTIGVEFGTRIIKVDDKSIKLQLWDTSGQENFRAITRAYYRGAAGVLIVFNLTCRKSFENIKYWLEDAKKHCNEESVMILIGNKADLKDERVISVDEANNFAKENKLLYKEVSAKDSLGVDEAFVDTAQIINKKVLHGYININNETCGVRLGPHCSKEPCISRSDAKRSGYCC